MSAFDSAVPGQVIRNDYSATSVTTGSYVQLTAALAHTTNCAEVFDSSGKTLQLAIGPAGGEQLLNFMIMPGGNGRMGLLLNKGARLSVIAVDATASTGQLVINLYR